MSDSVRPHRQQHNSSAVPRTLQARTLEWVAISFSNAWKWKVKVKSLSRVWLVVTPWTAAYQSPLSMGFSRQEYWSGVPLPSPRKASTSALLTMPKPLTVWITTNWKILKEMGISDNLTCLLRNLYAGQEATVRTEHGTTDWFQIGKGVRQGCILSLCLFNLHAEYIMRNAGWKKHKLESRLPGEISITSDMQMTPPLLQKVKN